MIKFQVSSINWVRPGRSRLLFPQLLLVLLIGLGQATAAHAQPQQAGLAQDELLFQEATQLLEQKLYPDAIEKLKQAYYLSRAPRLLDNIAAVYALLAKQQPVSSSAIRNAQEGLGYGRLYLKLEKDAFNCRVLDAIVILQKLASHSAKLTESSEPSDYTLQAIHEFESAYAVNANPDLRYCVAAAYKERGLDSSRANKARLHDVELALRTYQDYQAACEHAESSYAPRDCTGDIQTLQRAEQELRAELGRKIPIHKRTWFRALIAVVAVGAAAGVIAGVTTSVTRSSLLVPAEAWLPSNQVSAR